jgi:hypothetical protein
MFVYEAFSSSLCICGLRIEFYTGWRRVRHSAYDYRFSVVLYRQKWTRSPVRSHNPAPLFGSIVNATAIRLIERTNNRPTDQQATQIMSIEIQPTQLPRDSSTIFSDQVERYVRAIIQPGRDEEADRVRDLLTIPLLHTNSKLGLQAIERGTLCDAGKLRKDHQWLDSVRHEAASEVEDAAAPKNAPAAGPSRKHRVLLLGSG